MYADGTLKTEIESEDMKREDVRRGEKRDEKSVRSTQFRLATLLAGVFACVFRAMDAVGRATESGLSRGGKFAVAVARQGLAPAGAARRT